jgi:3-dehydroquinate dehydratase
MPALNVIEVRIDYLGKIDPQDYARITRDAYAAAGDKVVLVTLRNGTDGGPFIADDGTAASSRPSSRKAAPTSSTLSSSATEP